MRVLIIEDNVTTAAFIKGLKESLCTPEIAEDGEMGLYLAQNQPCDAIILDVMLPKMDGWEVLQKIRQLNNTIPIICLTARDAVNDRVKGLALGADDYLIKPFAFSELLARLHALLRRQSNIAPRVLTVANLTIDPDQYRAMRKGSVLSLTCCSSSRHDIHYTIVINPSPLHHLSLSIIGTPNIEVYGYVRHSRKHQ